MVEERPPPQGLQTRTQSEGATVDVPASLGIFTTGQVLGDRYEILQMLGRGGMGEVWRAFDLKLRVEVGLKALRGDLFESEHRIARLRQEVRAAREVVSPNVCRIFDLIEIDGRELVSMEYVDGATLLGVLQERGPLELKEAQDIASQFLAGLEAIHKAGLVHRDVKPENIMLTRAGRVVVMDFGLARQETEGGGSVSGTPAYMAPEHAAGQEVDARADVYSAGVVLAEMVSPEGIKTYESRQSVWEGVRSEPAQVPDSPWAPVIQRAVARDRERRPNSAHTLIRELEDVTLRVEGAEDLHPYPGLASFSEEDAEYFFGREAEIERMWRKLEGPSRLLALVGPSGAGKTSFLQAGLISHAGTDWRCVISKPGTNPVLGLSRALAPEMAGDVKAMDLLLRFDDPDVAVDVISRWGRSTEHALLIVDQFEELFTQNSVEEQRRFADLLGRIVLEADVFVVLSMRDDFMMRCRDLDPLEPIFSEMTALPALAGGSLRRALVRPATKCGYRFEDDELVEETLTEIEGERGALPMLAFAASRLWEKRDRETGLLTRQAYHDIGGVGGALARHAEATVDHIGVERIPIVRELFRNLVTAEGTRAVREWDDLLSVFGGEHRPSKSLRTSGDLSTRESDSLAQDDRRGAAAEVLSELIDARLLTSYEVREDEHEPIRRVEIIHESLLANWPRLVRWQTQDQEGAQLRDELRQAAKTWTEHDRTDDLLWTGTAYREFRLWRERYPGGLTEAEEAFGTAMTTFANRRKLRRRIVATAAFAILLVVLVVVGTLWRRSIVETRRAEAAGLLSQARVELESFPTAAVAYATASLGLADSIEARHLAVEALWKGPTAFVVNEGPSWNLGFTPDGRHLVQTTDSPAPCPVHIIEETGEDIVLDGYVPQEWLSLLMGQDGGFATMPFGGGDEPIALWSVAGKKLKATFTHDETPWYRSPSRAAMAADGRLVLAFGEEDRIDVHVLDHNGQHTDLGSVAVSTITPDGLWLASLAPDGRMIAASTGHDLFVTEITKTELGRPRLIGHQDVPIERLAVDPRGRYVATRGADHRVRLWNMTGSTYPEPLPEPVPDASAGIAFTEDGSLLQKASFAENVAKTRIWSLSGDTPRFLREIDLGKHAGVTSWNLNPKRRQIVSAANPDSKIRLWPIEAPADVAPIIMQQGTAGSPRRTVIHPNGQWLATSFTTGLSMWPLARDYPLVIDRYEERFISVVFGPEGDWIATSAVDGSGTVRVWRLEGNNLPPARVLHQEHSHTYALAASPDGKHLLLGTHGRGALLLSVDDGLIREPPVDQPALHANAVAFNSDGRLGAARVYDWGTAENEIRVWNLKSHRVVARLREDDLSEKVCILFSKTGTLFLGTPSRLFEWNPETGSVQDLLDISVDWMAIDTDETLALTKTADQQGHVLSPGRLMVTDLASGATSTLSSHGDQVVSMAMDEAGTLVVSGDNNGVIRVGPITGEEPYLLLGSPAQIWNLAIDPKGRWIASTSGTELRLWPMPDLSKPPLHTLPREELIAKLKTLTNLRVVRDAESATGWTLTHDPFPGWETVPTW